MKISKQRLIEIIKEEVAAADSTQKLGTGSTSSSEIYKSFKQSGENLKDAEITPRERQVINQMKDMIEKSAKELEIGSGKPFQLLQRVYKMLDDAVEDKVTQK